MKKNKFSFTLVEVLIVITIIGITVALIIPTLMNSYNERTTVVKLKQAQAIFSTAYAMVRDEYGDFETLDISAKDTPVGANKLNEYFKQFLKIEKDCGFDEGCFADEYTALDLSVPFYLQPNSYGNYTKGYLSNGMSYAFWSAGTGCKDFPAGLNGSLLCGIIYVDINGYMKPNRAGVDYFSFAITNKGILPLGHSEGSQGEKCVYNDSSATNGIYCAAWAIENENLDYLHKSIDW